LPGTSTSIDVQGTQMSARTLDDDQRAALKTRIAANLRQALAGLVEFELSEDDLREAASESEALLDHTHGPHRPRWYESDMSIPKNRLGYLDFSPIRGPFNAVAPPLELDYAEEADGKQVVVGRALLGTAYEGPPHGVHGGWVAALMDEVLGFAQRIAGQTGVTATLKIRYRKVTPIDEELRFRAWIHEDRGKVLVVRGTCHAGDTLTADAEGMFYRIDFETIRERMQDRRSDG
jgi:acyl-coenzyme A thioesterase PaaI-like protein